MFRKTFKYRLYPTKAQITCLEHQLGEARSLYNAALQERRDAWKMQRVSRNYYDQASELKEIRDAGNLQLANFSACQDVLRRVNKTFAAFFRRVKAGGKAGFPRFKGHDRFVSYTFPAWGDGCHLTEAGRLYVQGVGIVKLKLHRPIAGQIKTLTLKRETGKWYACFSVECEPQPLSPSDRAVGIDVGLESFAVTSDGEFIENPRFLKEAEAVLRKAQRKVARRKKGSIRRRKAVRLLAKHHLRVHNQRKDFAHKLSRRIVNTYGLIAVEDLQIANMVRNHHLAKSISDAAWGMFLGFTEYKAEEAGTRVFTRVIPNGTSQDCAFCGAVVPKTLAVRIHRCPNCGRSVPRDFNSSLNIVRRGLRLTPGTWHTDACVDVEAVCFS